MAASRKLYRMIAENVKQDLEGNNGQRQAGIALVVRESIAPALKADNPNFRYDYFFEACGLDEFGLIPN